MLFENPRVRGSIPRLATRIQAASSNGGRFRFCAHPFRPVLLSIVGKFGAEISGSAAGSVSFAKQSGA
jgi:hypothetical protein